MTYSYAKRPFPRRRRPSRGGAAGWLAAAMLAAAVIGLWWARSRQSPAQPSLPSIIASSAAVNNPAKENSADPATVSQTQSSLTLGGGALWGVQTGIYATQQAAEQAAGPGRILWQEEDGWRVLDSLWSGREAAKQRGEQLSGDSYALQLDPERVTLRLTGEAEKLQAVTEAAECWQRVLTGLLQVQPLVGTQAMAPDAVRAYARAQQQVLARAAEQIPGEEGPLGRMKEAVGRTAEVLGEIVSAKAETEVDFAEIFRYNVGISHNIYRDYLQKLISS